MLNTILTALYYACPGMIANSSPIIGRGILKALAVPIDFGKKLRGKRIFGDHKTLRGFVLAIFTGLLIGLLQFLAKDIPFFANISFIEYTLRNSLITGGLFGFAALFGDALESFVKRQFDISPGKPFIPFDQVDYVAGIALFSLLIRPMTWTMILWLLVLGPVLSILTTQVGFLLKIRKERL